MTGSDELFKLIHTLSRNEKRFFKLYCSLRPGEKTYLLLFDVIEKQESYNEIKAKKIIKDNFPAVKNYLLNLIVKTLSIYHDTFSDDIKIRNLLNSVELLYYKGLYKQAFRFLERAKKIALTHEKNMLLLQVYEWETKIRGRKLDLEKSKTYIQDDYEYELGILKNYQVLLQCRRYSTEVYYLRRTIGFPRNGEEKDMYEDIAAKVKSVPNFETSFLATYHYYTALSMCYLHISDYKSTYYYCNKKFELSKKNKDRIPNRYYAISLFHSWLR